VHRTDEPLPDFAAVQGDPDTYENRHPDPADVAIVIEVADSTVAKYRKEKLTLLADRHQEIRHVPIHVRSVSHRCD